MTTPTKSARATAMAAAAIPLPSIEVCLYGESRKCPKVRSLGSSGNHHSSTKSSKKGPSLSMFLERNGSTDDDDDDDDDDNDKDVSNDNGLHGNGEEDYVSEDGTGNTPSVRSSGYDSFHLGHWGEAAQQHDINMVQLRKIASQGIADEGSHRAVAWRVLLNTLPIKDIRHSWQREIPPQRQLYRQLVEQYFEGTMDRGRELRGQLSKTLRDRTLRKKYNRLQRLDESADNLNASGISEEGEEDEEEDEQSVLSEPAHDVMAMATTTPIKGNNNDNNANLAASPLKTMSRIQDALPPIFREKWKRSGINLDKAESTTLHYSSAMALGLNILTVPKLDETMEKEFQVFMDDAKLLEEIRKDVTRTHPDLFFYLEPNDNLGLRRYGALERILFVWSKLNKGVRYVQGMNEIVGTIYYVLANDHNSDWANHAEADTYFLFQTLMMDMKDVFVPDMDSQTTGIKGRIDNMELLLKTHDPEVYEHLTECGIDSSFYAIRWLTTLLSREFLLPDTIRLWDSMFASTHKENFLRYVCGTMVMMIRDDLLKGDFAACLRLLQSYPPRNVDEILESSRSLWIYESQITLACHKGGISLHQALQAVTPPSAIIMAFGLRGGVAPNLHDRLETAAQQAQEKVHSATEGLLGRAQRLWSGWGNSSATDTPTPSTAPSPAPQTTTQTTETPTTTPQRSRFWNRSRSNTNDSATSSTGAMTPSTKPENSTTDTPIASASPSIIRRALWNQSPASHTPPRHTDAKNLPDTPKLPVLPTSAPSVSESVTPSTTSSAQKRRIWNKGPTPRSTADNSDSNDTVPVI